MNVYHSGNVGEPVKDPPAHYRVADFPLLPPGRRGIIRYPQQLFEFRIVQEDEMGIADLPPFFPLQELYLPLNLLQPLLTEITVLFHLVIILLTTLYPLPSILSPLFLSLLPELLNRVQGIQVLIRKKTVPEFRGTFGSFLL